MITRLLIFLTFPVALWAQQVADKSFTRKIDHPAYGPGQGPIIWIDEGHENFHTANGRYQAFAQLLTLDGYQVKPYPHTFTQDQLKNGKILVIANAIHPSNAKNWITPTPSAFSNEEIESVKNWVIEGGNLFLIADHMPFPGAAASLAQAFGFEFSNGFAMHPKKKGPATFRLADQSLEENEISAGTKSSEKVNKVASFTGQAFKIPPEATSVLTFREDEFINLLPDTAWVFGSHTKTMPAKGWSQGAFRSFGQGRVVMWGEAAMFTAQVSGAQKSKMGMNHKKAKQNHQLLLNIIHWLDQSS